MDKIARMSVEVREFQKSKTIAECTLISRCRMPSASATQRACRRKTFSLAAVAALLVLAIGTSACLYIPPIPSEPTPIPGWDENKFQVQRNGIDLQQSAEGRGEVASSVAAKPSASTH